MINILKLALWGRGVWRRILSRMCHLIMLRPGAVCLSQLEQRKLSNLSLHSLLRQLL